MLLYYYYFLHRYALRRAGPSTAIIQRKPYRIGRMKTSAYHLQPIASESTILRKKEGPLPASGLSSPLHPLFLVLTAWLDYIPVAGQSPSANQGSF